MLTRRKIGLALLPVLLALPAMTAEAQIPVKPTPNVLSVSETADRTFVVGPVNAAPQQVRLVEYLSYTCEHCMNFEREAGVERDALLTNAGVVRLEVNQSTALNIQVRNSGVFSVEVHNVVRDPVDLATALLVRCGPTETFFKRHDAFMLHQPETLAAITPEVRAQWRDGKLERRLRRTAEQTGLLDFAETQGISRSAGTACLADKQAIRELLQMREAAEKSGVRSVPSFGINGVVVDAHDWNTLRPMVRQAVDQAIDKGARG